MALFRTIFISFLFTSLLFFHIAEHYDLPYFLKMKLLKGLNFQDFRCLKPAKCPKQI